MPVADAEKLPVPIEPSMVGPPPPTWSPGLSPHHDDWEHPGGIADYAVFERTCPGTNVNCRYRFYMVSQDSPMPRLIKRKRPPPLPALERALGRRPQLGDRTIRAYIERGESLGSLKKRRELGSFLPTSMGTTIYVVSGTSPNQFVMYDYERFVTCAHCGKDMCSYNGRKVTRVDTFRFRACCFPNPTFKIVRPTATTTVSRIVKLVYDLETTPDDEGKHVVYLGAIMWPEEMVASGNVPEDMSIIWSPAELMTAIDRALTYFNALNEPNLLLQLVSFNGSRYDDLLLADAWRNYVADRYGIRKLRTLNYSERKRALTHNTLTLENVTLEWTDVLRFVPPTSLRQLAQDLHLDQAKGNMPFQVLNDFVAQGPLGVRRDEDGFFSLNEYFHGDAVIRAETYEYYQQVVPQQDRTPSKDVRKLCEEYCKQDVRVLAAIYDHLDQKTYTPYLKHLVRSTQAATQPFLPMAKHSLSTLAGNVLLDCATNTPCWGYNSETNEVNACFRLDGELHVPTGPTYDYVSKSIYGGWTKGYFQGFVAAPDLPEDLAVAMSAAEHWPNMPHFMTDVASMYPAAVTMTMPVGLGKYIEDPAQRELLITRCLEETDPCRIPLFFFRGSWKAPTKPVFSESTLPQRTESANSLRWTYWDDHSCRRHYNSLDLWIAARDHLCLGPETHWHLLDCVDMLYFPQGAQLYREFMRECTKLKMDGAAEGNVQKRTTGKIAMNGSVGKLGQQVNAQQNVMGTNEAENLISVLGDKAELRSVRDASYGRFHWQTTEYVFSVKDAYANNWPGQHASFMYAATRLMRLIWNIMTRPPGVVNELVLRPYPDTFYGDTDSKIQPLHHAQCLPPDMIGDTVGWFKPEEPPTWLNRPFFNLEPEAICANGFRILVSGILAPKKYFCWAYNDTTKQYKLKFKCNGLTRFSEGRYPCPLHGTRRCAACNSCPHGQSYLFECWTCSMDLLTREVFSVDDVTQGVLEVSGSLRSGEDYKYNVLSLQSLTLLDFGRVLVTQRECQVLFERFDRTLSQRTSKLPEFSIRTVTQSRRLNYPRTLTTRDEVVRDHPSGAALAPMLCGLAHNPTRARHLWPAGTYVLPHMA